MPQGGMLCKAELNGSVQPRIHSAMRRFVLLAGLVLLLIALVGGGVYWWRVYRFIESTDDAYVQADISVISPKVEGYVSAVKVTDNQAVHEGDLLVVIDDRDFRARDAEAAAAVAAQQAAIANIDSQGDWQQSEIKRAAAAAANAEVELRHAEQD